MVPFREGAFMEVGAALASPECADPGKDESGKSRWRRELEIARLRAATVASVGADPTGSSAGSLRLGVPPGTSRRALDAEQPRAASEAYKSTMERDAARLHQANQSRRPSGQRCSRPTYLPVKTTPPFIRRVKQTKPTTSPRFASTYGITVGGLSQLICNKIR